MLKEGNFRHTKKLTAINVKIKISLDTQECKFFKCHHYQSLQLRVYRVEVTRYTLGSTQVQLYNRSGNHYCHCNVDT